MLDPHAHRLEALRKVGDPLLDVLEEPRLRSIASALQAPGRFPAPFEDQRLPRRADPARLARAGRFFLRHAVPLSMLLGSTSLLECFVCGPGARALHGARTMRRATTRRVGETGQFVLDLFAPGAWTPGGGALRTLLRVRLVHAIVRRHVPAGAPGEVALNQEDQLGTLLAFGLSPLLHLRAMGVEVTTEDVEDSLHLWATAGEVLGVAVEHLPREEAGAADLAARIRARHFEPSVEGRALTASLLAAYAGVTRSPRIDALFASLLRTLNGPALCDALAVPEGAGARAGRALASGVGVSTRAWVRVARLPGLGAATEALIPLALGGHARRMAGGRAQFAPPAAA